MFNSTIRVNTASRNHNWDDATRTAAVRIRCINNNKMYALRGVTARPLFFQFPHILLLKPKNRTIMLSYRCYLISHMHYVEFFGNVELNWPKLFQAFS